ncbi:MAG: glycosyltransferase [Deltaproteobacteria bacterium]|jgi:spore maturation protein CgeB|nr:glycosyltransferase [Deltaproteobacteria bacterium]
MSGPLEGFLPDSLAALARQGRRTTLEWLAAPGQARTEAVAADDGRLVLVIDGQSQDSRREPDAGRWLNRQIEEAQAGPTRQAVWLFGWGSPSAVRLALSRFGRLTVYEPDPAAARAALTFFDFRPELEAGRLEMASPWLVAEGAPAPQALLLIHPASARRAPAALAGLRRFLPGERRLAGEGRLLIVPPFSGGSLPMAGFLARAAEELGLDARLLSWSPPLTAAAEALKAAPEGGPAAPGSAALFRGCAEQAAEAAAAFDPSLVLVLAQAPLDARGVALVREKAPASPTAFWFVEDFRRFGYVSEVAPAYDLFFHLQGPLMTPNLKNWGLPRAWTLPAAAEPSLFRPRTDVPAPYRATVSFMGAGYPNRRAILADFAANWARRGRRPEDFRIFGSGWDRCPPILRPHLFEDGRRVTAEECALIYAGAQVSLNIHSGDAAGFDRGGAFVNPRTFEAAAAGSPQVVDRRELLADAFDDDEISAVDEPAELLTAVERLLDDPPKARRQAQAARARVLKEHLYAHRLAFIMRHAR